MKYTNQNPKKNISIYPSMNDKYKYNYGEKVREKHNFSLYVSGSGYIQPKDKEINSKKEYHYKNYSRNKNSYGERKNKISNQTNNFGYKDTKSIKNKNLDKETRNYNFRTESPMHTIDNTNMNRKMKIKNDNYINQDIDNSEEYRELQQNRTYENFRPLKGQKIYEESFRPEENMELIEEVVKTENCYNYNDDYYDSNYQDFDNLNYSNTNEIINNDTKTEITKEGDYLIKVTTTTKEYEPNQINNIYTKNRNSKIIIEQNKQPDYNNEDYKTYQRENLERINKYHNIQQIPTYYMTEKEVDDDDDYELMRKYQINDNYNRSRYMEEYGENSLYRNDCDNGRYEDNFDYQNQFIVNSRENMDYDIFENRRDYEHFNDIKGVKNIYCPLHGKISISIHENPYGYNIND